MLFGNFIPPTMAAAETDGEPPATSKNGITKVVINQDFAWDTPIRDALELISKHHGRISGFVVHPSRGPNITLVFNNRRDSVEFLREFSKTQFTSS